MLGWALLVALLTGWWFTLAPTLIGGPTAYVVVVGTSMEPRWQTGDVVLTRATDSYEVGDVISFHTPDGRVIHRIVDGDQTSGFTTQGDNRATTDSWTTQSDDIVGEEWVTLPVDVRTLLRWAPWAVGLFTFALIAWPSRKQPEADPSAPGVPEDHSPAETEKGREPACAVPSR